MALGEGAGEDDEGDGSSEEEEWGAKGGRKPKQSIPVSL